MCPAQAFTVPQTECLRLSEVDPSKTRQPKIEKQQIRWILYIIDFLGKRYQVVQCNLAYVQYDFFNHANYDLFLEAYVNNGCQ